MVIRTIGGLRFELRARTLREVLLTKEDPYSATRADVKKAFQGKATAINYKIGSTLMYSHPANIELISGYSIRIGCCEFRDRNFTVLRKWALGVK